MGRSVAAAGCTGWVRACIGTHIPSTRDGPGLQPCWGQAALLLATGSPCLETPGDGSLLEQGFFFLCLS